MKKTQIWRRNPYFDDSFLDSGDISLRSGENLTGFDEISQDSVKISLDLREMSPKSRFLHRILENSCRILENSHRKLKILAGIWKFWPESGNLSVSSGFSGFRGGKLKPTRRNRFLVVKIRRRPAGEFRSARFRSVPVGFSGGSGYQINLDSPTNNTTSTFNLKLEIWYLLRCYYV